MNCHVRRFCENESHNAKFLVSVPTRNSETSVLPDHETNRPLEASSNTKKDINQAIRLKKLLDFDWVAPTATIFFWSQNKRYSNDMEYRYLQLQLKYAYMIIYVLV